MKHRKVSGAHRSAGVAASGTGKPVRSTRFTVSAVLAGVLAVAIPAGAVAAITVRVKTPADYTAAVVASDAFGRTVVSGFGRADAGGVYNNPTPSASGTSVRSGHAIVASLKPGKSFSAWLPSVSTADTLSQISLTVPSISAARDGLYLGLETRRQADGRAYRGKIYVDARGRALLNLSRTAARGVETSLGDFPLPFALTSGRAVTIQTQVTGSNPVVVSVRAWPTGIATPGWQLSRADSAAARLTAAGGVGVWGYRSGGGTTHPFYLDNFTSWKLTAPVSSSPAPTTPVPTTPVPTTPVPTTPVPTTPAPTTPAPTTPAPTTPAPTTPAPTTPAPTPPVGTAAVGSVPVGTAQYAVPAGALFVAPSGSDSAPGTEASPMRTVQAAINKAPAGGTVVMRAGTYHESVVITKANLTLQAYPGEAVWFDGSSVVSGWTQSGSTWVHSGWTNQFDHSASFSYGQNSAAFINPAYPLAAWPDQAFVDGTELNQVGSAPGSDSFAVDYGAQTLTIGTDPAGREIRSSDLSRAILVTGKGVVLEGFGVRRYGTPLPMMGTVLLYGGSDTARNLVISDNATQGISLLNAGNTIDHLSLLNMGMTGIHANEADNSTIENSYVTGSNRENFNRAPSAGGMKITRSVGITISGNSTVNNNSTGIWLDESVRNFTIVNNTSTGNTKGMTFELSANGTVANNTINGGEYGMYVLDTGNVRIFNNSISNVYSRQIALIQDARRQAANGAVGRDPRMPVPDPTCPWLTQNDIVANNTFDTAGRYQVMVQDQQTNIPADSMNMTVDGNRFASVPAAGGATPIAWGLADNRTLTMYTDVSSFDSQKGKGWTNTQTSSGAARAVSAGSVDATAVPLPSDIATLVGVPAGTRHIGTFN